MVVYLRLKGGSGPFARSMSSPPQIKLPAGVKSELPETGGAGRCSQRGQPPVLAEPATGIARIARCTGQQLGRRDTQLCSALLYAFRRHLQAQITGLGSLLQFG